MLTNDNLDSLVERFWGETSPDSPVLVTGRQLPDSHVLVEEYAVVPSVRRARFLVPLGAPRAVATAFTSHLTTVSRSSRLSGAALALGFRSRAAHLAVSDRLRVGIDRTVPVAQRRHHLVLSELAHRLDAPDLVAVHPVRRATPNAKPTARLFSRNDGSALGYAKLGWSPPTARLVQNEASVLSELGGEVAGLTVPHLRSAGRWTGGAGTLDFLVSSALPPGLRAWRRAPEDDPTTLMGVAESGDRDRCRLVDSRYAESVDDRLRGASAQEPEAVSALTGWFRALTRSEHVLDFGRWHGDWVAWNLATTADGGAVWDWEYSAAQAPLGFDLLHWHFQSSLSHPAATLDTAATDLVARLPGLARVGLPPDVHRYVADIYLLEMLTRAVGLAAQGSGWNPKLHPRLIGFAKREAGSPA